MFTHVCSLFDCAQLLQQIKLSLNIKRQYLDFLEVKDLEPALSFYTKLLICVCMCVCVNILSIRSEHTFFYFATFIA